LYGKVRRSKLWVEACQTASDLENTHVICDRDTSPYQTFYGTKSPVLQHLHQFGEIGIVENHTRRTIISKLENRGRPCIYVGKVPAHTTDVYKFLNLETHKMISSRNVTWLHQVYGDWAGLQPSDLVTRLADLQDTDVFPANDLRHITGTCTAEILPAGTPPCTIFQIRFLLLLPVLIFLLSTVQLHFFV
jgi:hypothetical protein